MTSDLIKALSLECLKPQTVKETDRNNEIFKELEELDQKFINSPKSDRIKILARVYDLCLIMDVI